MYKVIFFTILGFYVTPLISSGKDYDANFKFTRATGIVPGAQPYRGSPSSERVHSRNASLAIVGTKGLIARQRFSSGDSQIVNQALTLKATSRHVSLDAGNTFALAIIDTGKSEIDSISVGSTNSASLELMKLNAGKLVQELRNAEQEQSKNLPVLPKFPDPPATSILAASAAHNNQHHSRSWKSIIKRLCCCCC